MSTRSIYGIQDCYGCGLCAVSCPRKIIQFDLNKEGFYAPYITDTYLCTNCGLCLSVCSYSDEKCTQDEVPIGCFAAWSNDDEVRQLCSSGGVSYELMKTAIDLGHKIIGVKFDAKTNRAVHYVAETMEKSKATIGSKYIQSYTIDALKSINKKEKYLVTGAPCQIDSFRRYIKKLRCEDNFVLMDFFCHGVPSMNLWMKYYKETEKITGKIVDVSWRNKTYGRHDSWNMNICGRVHEKIVGWHDSYNLILRGEKHVLNSKLSQGDLFFKMFLSNSCLGKSCYEKCKFKGASSSADIRIGDFWGKTYEKDEKGVSSVITFTKKGQQLFEQTNCHLVYHHYDTVIEGQLRTHLKAPLSRGFICRMLATRIPLKLIFYFVQFTRLPYLIKCKLRQ